MPCTKSTGPSPAARWSIGRPSWSRVDNERPSLFLLFWFGPFLRFGLWGRLSVMYIGVCTFHWAPARLVKGNACIRLCICRKGNPSRCGRGLWPCLAWTPQNASRHDIIYGWGSPCLGRGVRMGPAFHRNIGACNIQVVERRDVCSRTCNFNPGAVSWWRWGGSSICRWEEQVGHFEMEIDDRTDLWVFVVGVSCFFWWLEVEGRISDWWNSL